MTSIRIEDVVEEVQAAGDGPTPSKYVAHIRPYEAASSRDKIGHGGADVFKLDWNESTIPPSPRVIEAIARFLGNTHHLNWYPELYSKRLVTKLSGYVGVDEASVLVTNGSDDALDLVCRTYLDEGDEVVVPSPTYTHFLVYAGARGAQILRVYGEDPFHQNLDGVLRSIGHRTKLVYLVSPNNPTGLLYSEEQVAQVLEAAPQAIVIVDEAYFEFCGQSVVGLTRRYRNLVVTRTFSKSFGIAGLRIGYAVADPQTIDALKRIFNPKSVNALGQVAAEAALDDREYLDNYVRSVTAAKELIREHLTARGVECRVTPGNYVLIRLSDPKRFCALLEDEGVFIRDRSSIAQMQHYARMSVGTIEQTSEILARVDRALARMPYVVRAS